MVCLIVSAIQKSHFICSSSQCIWDCCLSLACYNSVRYCHHTSGFLFVSCIPTYSPYKFQFISPRL